MITAIGCLGDREAGRISAAGFFRVHVPKNFRLFFRDIRFDIDHDTKSDIITYVVETLVLSQLVFRKEGTMKFVTMIPLNRNDGSAIQESEIQEVLQKIIKTFGGLTVEGTVDGSWVEGNETYRDKNLKVSVACDNSRYEEAKQLVIEIGRRFDQLAMYFEVCYFDGVQILETS